MRSANCTAAQAATLMMNAWKYLRIDEALVRILPPDAYLDAVGIVGHGQQVLYRATIQVLPLANAGGEPAAPECEAILRALFPELG